MMESKDFSNDDSTMDDDLPLPGFRFHPTDQELVSFYLRRKIDGKPLSVELIKQIDIYKYDPWDLPKASSTGREKEWYFFCKRGRKYRNSIRPNRVTGSGFWKATGIDKPVYSLAGEENNCIGLKKTLVYYRGSAGKGTKTDWMMHEFRLPSTVDTATNSDLPNANRPNNTKTSPATAQEAEVWTLCRIFKRNVTQKKYTPDWRPLAPKRHSNVDKNTRTSRMDSNTNQESYINFGASSFSNYDQQEQKPFINNYPNDPRNNQFHVSQIGSHQVMPQPQPQLVAPSSNFWINQSGNDLFVYENWDELGSVVKFALDSPLM